MSEDEILVRLREAGDVLTIEQAAEYLKIGRTTMYALVASGAVRSITIGRLRRVPVECLKSYVADLLAEARPGERAA